MSRGLRGVHWIVRVGLAGLFIATGAAKLLEPGVFAEDIGNYQVLPASMVGLIALYLPLLELVAGAAVLWPRYARGAASLCALMLLGFAAAMAQSKLRGIDLDCGCFGALADAQVSWTKVTANLALAMLAAWTVTSPLGQVPRPTGKTS